MQPYITERMLHEEAAGMNLEESFFVKLNIDPDEPVARWELTRINPLRIDLYPVGRGKKQSIASVFHSTGWHTWDELGIGGENGGEEENIDAAILEVYKACLRQGFL